jgi:hypothetical protein
MDPYVFVVLERQALEERARARPHTWHMQELMTERAAVRRSRRHRALRAFVGMLRRHAAEAPVPAGVGGRP